MIENKLEMEKTNSLYAEIRAVLEKARSSAYRAVNLAMVQAYWQIGYLIVEHEQEGKEQAEYGKALLKELSGRLSGEFGKGFDVTNLRKMRQFYLLFSKRDSVRLKSDKTNRDAMSPDSMEIGKTHSLRGELSWTHYRLMLRVENDKAREWYMNEAADQKLVNPATGPADFHTVLRAAPGQPGKRAGQTGGCGETGASGAGRFHPRPLRTGIPEPQRLSRLEGVRGRAGHHR
jgi:hypothetical protein